MRVCDGLLMVRTSAFLQSDLIRTWYRWSVGGLADCSCEHKHVCQRDSLI